MAYKLDSSLKDPLSSDFGMIEFWWIQMKFFVREFYLETESFI